MCISEYSIIYRKYYIWSSQFKKSCQEGKQLFVARPVICKVCQAGKQFSVITPVICKVYQAGKQFSVSCKKPRLPACQTLQITGITAEIRLFA